MLPVAEALEECIKNNPIFYLQNGKEGIYKTFGNHLLTWEINVKYKEYT